MSGLGEGNTHASRELNGGMYLKTGDPGLEGGGTYTGTATEGTLQQYENIFGPAGRDIKLDNQRHKRHQRWHLPDALKGHNQYLTDRVDGLITDATNSPFTKNILPYVYLENPDQKLKWNVYSFDEGIASRVPYEAAARVLPQTKRSFAGYTVRQGLAIAMEHNFMVSAAGRENFKNQLTQLVGSIQLTNDLDVHVALLQAPSYQKHMNEKYYDNTRTTSQVCRQYIDLFGIMQKIPNALDILIEDAKSNLQTWGSQPPTFCLCNSALTTQLTMLPELTNYVTNGPDGAKRLAQGPNLTSYRGLQIIPSRKFSMDAGTAPRDLLRRRVRVAEYYRIPWTEHNASRTYEFYDQSRDTMFTLSWSDLVRKSKMSDGGDLDGQHSDRISDIATGKWSYESFESQSIPSWTVNTFNPQAQILNNGILLKGRKAADTTALYLDTTGFYYSKDMKHYSRSRRMSIADVLRATNNMRSLVEDGRIISGVSHSTMKLIHRDLANRDQMLPVAISALAEQSELFGRGLYNDPIVTTTESEERFLTNFDSLSQFGVTRDFEKHWLVVSAFERLETLFTDPEYGSIALEKSLRNGDAKYLNSTPIADLQCLGSFVLPLVSSKVNPCDLPCKYALKQTREMLKEIMGLQENNIISVRAVAANTIDRRFSELLGGIGIISMDGDMNDEFYSIRTPPYRKVTRKDICDLFIRLYKALKGHDYEAIMRQAINKNFSFTDALQLQVEYEINDDFTCIEEKPNVFFLWILCTVRSQADLTIIDDYLKRYNDVLGQLDRDILSSFVFPGANNHYVMSAVAVQLCNVFHAAEGIYRQVSNHLIYQYMIGNVMRSVNNLLKLYDVPSVNNNDTVAGQLDNNAIPHHIFIDCMVAAATAFVTYRQNMQRDSSSKLLKGVFKGEVAALTHRECLRNSALTMVCSSSSFTANVLNKEKNAVQRSLNELFACQYGNNHLFAQGAFYNYLAKGWNPMDFELNDAQQQNNILFDKQDCSHVGYRYWEYMYTQFAQDMVQGSPAVKRTHNIMMQTSRSGGANISHFPNYHINRCNEMCETDRVRSASSQDEATWIIQALAGLTPLSNTACRRMMGIQEHVHNIVVQQSAELFGAHAAHARPTQLNKDVNWDPKPALVHPLVGHPSYIESSSTPWAANELKTNLMLSVLAQFHPSAHVRQEINAMAFVPVHTQKQVMLAFADAIDKNLTSTDMLSEAICELFSDTPTCVPFCSETASSSFTMTPRLCESYRTMTDLMTHELSWEHVPIEHGEGSAPKAETTADRLERLGNEMQWNPYLQRWEKFNEHHVNNEGPSSYGLRMHPMRSFSPNSIAQTPGLKQPDKTPAARIHSDLKNAANNAAAFCRDPTNWPVFYKHVLLVWMSRFWQASTRFVDNGSGMMAHHAEPDPANKDQQIVKYFSNGLHFMHGPLLPKLGNNPNHKHQAVEQCDLVILRPNIEHEMLGVIMGRGGTQELGATFWGQTELSCYDDSQHGIWGMSYKYHERAMVTNERNMIRAYDVAFDGYNGGLDQTCVDWNDSASRKAFRDATYDRSKPYSGPSMLVMALPCSVSQQAWPNPILFHGDMAAGYSPDPEKSQGALPNMHEHMVFNAAHNPRVCTQATADRWSQYMVKLEMTQWSNADQSNRPAGESCVANESTSTPMAFQGSMRVMQGAALVEDVKGSGHLGHSYVGIASVREGRGVHNPAMQHSTMRLV